MQCHHDDVTLITWTVVAISTSEIRDDPTATTTVISTRRRLHINWRGHVAIGASAIRIRSWTVGIARPVVVAAIGNGRTDDGAGGEPTNDTGGSRSAISVATAVISATITVTPAIIPYVGD